MGGKATVPILVVAAIALIGFMVWWWGKSGLSGPGAASTEEAGLPSFIDPATKKPKGMGSPGGASSTTTGSVPTRGGGPGAAPGAAGGR